uniref:Uncharacterized protein n=1 Tax=Trichobilharzia regenti TaxID=157069 RepID=A0AA85IUR1_TRIRE|nr:unnamed protein product [Trichobilharzia regenti]
MRNHALTTFKGCLQKSDRMTKVQGFQWPKLCTLQSSAQRENKELLSHKSNQQEVVTKTYIPLSNLSVDTRSQSRILLPYPTLSINANVDSLNDMAAQSCTSSYGIQRKGDYNSSLHQNHHINGRHVLTTWDSSAVTQVVDAARIRNTSIPTEDLHQKTKSLYDQISTMSAEVSLRVSLNQHFLSLSLKQ